MCRGELSMCRGELSMCRGEPSMCRGELSKCRGEPSMCRGEPSMCRGEPSMCRGEPDGQDQWSRASSVCRSRASSLGKGMGEVVRQAREVRRLIREASVDSQASDLCLLNPDANPDLCLLEYDGPWSSPNNLPGSPAESEIDEVEDS